MRPSLSIVLPIALGAIVACGNNTPPPKVPTNVSPPVVPTLTSADIDVALHAMWKEKGITPSARADDATYLRRVYLDVIGTLPPPEKVTAFLADDAPDKRSKLVDALLASDDYSDHWAAYWDDQLMGDFRAQDVDRNAFRVWLEDEFKRNVAWDKLVYDLITASGKNSVGGKRNATLAQTEAQLDDDPKVDGAANYVLKYRGNPQDMAGATSKLFLGVQIQCAQCHDHKTEKWKQTDFRSFAACFMRTQLVPRGGQGMKGTIKSVEVRDLDRPAPRFDKNADLAPMAAATPTTLDGTALSGNVRQGVAAWITKNPWFAEEITNRMWGHFLGRGFSNPVDDVRESNPPDAPELMKRIAKDFTDHGSDLKRLIRLITQTEAYQLSAAPPANASKSEIPLWSQFRMTPLGPEELVNSLIAATGTQAALERLSRADIDDIKLRLTQLFSFVFDVDEEVDQPRYEGTLTQALVLLNGKLVAGGSNAGAQTTAVSTIARSKTTDAEKVVAIYLRTLSRRPTASELSTALAYVAASTAPAPPANPPPPEKKPKKGDKPGKKGAPPKDPIQKLSAVSTTQDPKVAALEDLMWATLNSSEFVFNH